MIVPINIDAFNIAAYTPPGVSYPEYISINVRKPGYVEITVRSPRQLDGREGSTAIISMPELVFASLVDEATKNLLDGAIKRYQESLSRVS